MLSEFHVHVECIISRFGVRCQCRLIWMYYLDSSVCMMLRQRASPPPQCRQELPGCHFLPQLLLFPASIEHSAVVQQTEPGINVAHTDQLSTDTVSALCSPGIAMLYYSLQGAVKQWFCGRVAAIERRMVQVARREGLHPGRHTGRGEDPPFISFFARTTNPGQEKIPENCAQGRR